AQGPRAEDADPLLVRVSNPHGESDEVLAKDRPPRIEGRHGDVGPFDPWIRPSDAFRPLGRALSYFGFGLVNRAEPRRCGCRRSTHQCSLAGFRSPPKTMESSEGGRYAHQRYATDLPALRRSRSFGRER